MALLLDTHAFMWFAEDSSRLSATSREAIRAEPVLRLSIASIWELSVKHALGRLNLIYSDFEDSVLKYIEIAEVELLPIELVHTVQLNKLPHHHRDPFDRMLVAQAIVEELTLVTSDRRLSEYPCSTLW